MAISIHQISPDLINKKCNVTFLAAPGNVVSVHGIPFDPPGDQTESQLRSLAISEAVRALQAVIDSNPS